MNNVIRVYNKDNRLYCTYLAFILPAMSENSSFKSADTHSINLSPHLNCFWIAILMLITNILYTMAFFVMLHDRNNPKQQTLVEKYKHYEQLFNGIQEKNRSLQRENERLTNEIKTLEKQFRKAAPENEEKPEKNLNSIYSVRTQKLLSRHLYRDIACFAYIGSYTYFQTKRERIRYQPTRHP